jgi:DNA-binding MarR family transcriptional regulator
MTLQETNSKQAAHDQVGLMRFQKLAPRPRTPRDTGLSATFLSDLTAKHLLDRGTLSLAELSQGLLLSGSIVEQVLDFMRSEALVEIRPNRADQPGLHYALTDRGRSAALDALLRSGYVGPAPVPLKHFANITRAQSVHKQTVSREAMYRAFEDIVLDTNLIDRLGPSLNSGRAIFLYGHAGTGKTFVSQRLTRLFPDLTLVPHAIAVGDNVVQLFDPLVHKVVSLDSAGDDHVLEKGHDPRFLLCERPAVITGGELTAEMLEVRYEPSAKLYEAPLQLKASNGVFLIDDLGRQRIEPMQLFNRWIVPLEEKKDFLSLQSGRHFTVPFDVVLIFSTNIHPLELADEAFLRRIGYKIEFKPLTPEEYERIWRDVCVEYEVDYDPEVLHYVINELHTKNRVVLLPCHPRDLLGIAVDYAVYSQNNRNVGIDHLRWAWTNYFVSLDVDPTNSGLQDARVGA